LSSDPSARNGQRESQEIGFEWHKTMNDKINMMKKWL